jgi:hypothetical protein
MSLDWEPWYNQLATEINSQRKIIKTYKNSWPSKPSDKLSSFKIKFWTSLDYN